MNVVGISAYYHDAACAVLRDGRLVASAQEERFSRRKHDPSLPRSAFRYCLAEAGLDITDIDCIAYYESPTLKLTRQLWAGLPDFPPTAPEALFRLDASRPEREIRELLGYEGRIESVDHHEAHAASAFFCSGFDEAALFTADGVGEWATTSYGRAGAEGLDLFEEVRFPHSLGLLYSAVTAFLGFAVNSDEYKVMGLAPYGRPRYVDQVWQLVEDHPGGQYRLAERYFDFIRGTRMFSEALCELFGSPPREPDSEITPFAEDVAHSLQIVLEEMMLRKVRWLHDQVPLADLCLAGGVALNCVANGQVRRRGPFRRVFVQPAAGDAGGSVGAAALVHRRLSGVVHRPEALVHVHLGPSYDPAEVRALLAAGTVATLEFSNKDDLCHHVAQRLAEGEVVGWFHGRMEFGPRALGARSILADPRRPEMRDRINALVKRREAFRPFAPSVLEEEADRHFDLDVRSPFMLETCQVRSPLELPAVTHIDGSARVQTVSAGDSPRFHRLLRAFADLTGCPVLLNTSFNLRGEPIVCTPVDAVLCFIRSDIDCLVLEDTVLERAAIPPSWIEWFRDTQPGPSTPDREMVYTFL